MRGRQRPALGRATLVWVGTALLASTATAGPGSLAERYIELKRAQMQTEESGEARLHRSLRSISRRTARDTGLQTALGEMTSLSGLAKADPRPRMARDDYVQVYVHAAVLGDRERKQLTDQGLEIEIVNASLGICQGWLPTDRLEAVSRLPFVNRITPPSYARHNTGSVITEGDAVLGTRSFRESGAGNGLGASVAVISNGVNSAADSAATGDLPDLSEIAQFGFCVPDELGVGLCDEGTAMLEIIHDLAPRAELGFCSAFTTLAFILCVDFDLAEDDEFQPDVIVDDVAFPFEPYFEDGPVAQAVAEAVARDVIYISAAGNFAQLHYEGDFLASTELGFDDGSGQLIPEHNFGLVAGAESDPTMDIPLPPGASLMVVMQWSDGFGVSASDYDLLILDAGRGKVLAASVGLQNGDADPIEDISFENLLPDTEVVQLTSRTHCVELIKDMLASLRRIRSVRPARLR